MFLSICCIAKDEDKYIDEWIKYHLSIGINQIIIFCDKWKYDFSQYNNQVISINCPEQWYNKNLFGGRQLTAYNNILINNQKKIIADYIFFIDCDEFITYNFKYEYFKNKHDFKLQQLFNDFEILQNVNKFGLPWKMFGSNNQLNIINNNFSVIQRFTKSEIGYNKHIKTCINCHFISNEIFINPHSILDIYNKQNTQKTIITNFINYSYGPYVNSYTIEPYLYLSHFKTKSKEEHILRCQKGNADFDNNHKLDDIELSFKEYDLNDIENFDVINTLKITV